MADLNDRDRDERDPRHDLRMTLLEHLEEMRRRLTISALAFLVATIVAYNFSSDMLEWFLKPVKAYTQLVWPTVTSPFVLQLRLAVYAGLVLASPVIIYQALAFILPGLEEHEKKFAYAFVPSFLILFTIGTSLAYFVFLPFAISFFAGFQTPDIKFLMSAPDAVGFTMGFVLPFGVIFELPVAVYFLTSLDIVRPDTLARNRKYAILAIFIIAAFLTPPDPVSQTAMAIPLIVLYEFSIWISRVAYRQRLRRQGEL